MGVTRLKRKARRNKQRAADRTNKIKQLTATPVIANVDKEELKASFKSAPVKEEKPKAKKAEKKEEAPKAEKAEEKATKKAAPKAKAKKEAEDKTEE